MKNEDELKASRKMTIEWARQNLLGKTILEPCTGKQIQFTGKGIKEAVNQPHCHYLEKNKAITEVVTRIKNAVLLREVVDMDRPYYSYRYYETDVVGESSYIVIRENWITGLVDFYSIVDKIKE